MHSREDALRMMRAGADALLVGTDYGEPERLGAEPSMSGYELFGYAPPQDQCG